MFDLFKKSTPECTTSTDKAHSDVQESTDSTHKVPYTTIKNITPHSGADRLEIAWVYGFQVIVRKDQYKVGDNVIYVPIDSILPEALELKIFGTDSKIKLHNHRVRQIRIRGLASQGMLIDTKDLEEYYFFGDEDLEVCFAEILEITKYEPPVIGPSQTIGAGRQRNKKTDNPHFRKFNGVANIKWFPDLFAEGEEVVVQEKIHGSHIRFGKAPYAATTWLKKLKRFLRLAPAFENVYGSNNVEISNKLVYKGGYYGDDIYGSLLKKEDAFEKIKDNEFVHAELYGAGVQKNYTYGCKSGEHRLIIFDVRILQPDGTQKWLDPDDVACYAKDRGFDMVPTVYRGAFSREEIGKLASGPSVLSPSQKVREGVVVKGAKNYDNEQNKKALKLINEAYLDDKSNTDFQ